MSFPDKTAASGQGFSRRVPFRAPVLALCLLAVPGMAHAGVVTNTNDSGAGSLREALATVPANGTVTFDIPGAGPHVIVPLTDLPIVTANGVTIDASTQPGAACNTVNQGIPHVLKIELRGGSATDIGLNVSGTDATVRGLSITGFSRPAIQSSARGFTLDCSYIGIRPDNVTTGANTHATNSNIAVYLTGQNGTITRSVVSGNDAGQDFGIGVIGGSGVVLTGNLIGLLPDGTTPAGNGDAGITLHDVTGGTIGGTASSARNVVGAGWNGLTLNRSTGVAILGNLVGIGTDGGTDVGSTLNGIVLENGSSATIGNGTAGGRNHIGGNDQVGILLLSGSSADIRGNTLGSGPGGTPLTSVAQLYVRSSSTATVTGNVIANASLTGIAVTHASGPVAIYANAIHSSGGLGIDLGDNGSVDANDAGDGDAGANDLLNFPLLDAIKSNGTTTVSYDITLDVPAHGPGYRVDFFKNTVSESHGEGEVHLGFVESLAPGTHSGSFTANAPVWPGDLISATTTRIVSGVTYDITSEFAATVIASSSPLHVTSIADTDTLGTLRHAINHANATPGDDAITFAIPGAGPHTIALATALPTIADAGISIDGTTQPGAACGQLTTGTAHALRIRLDGQGTAGNLLSVTGAGVVLKGLSVGNATGKGFFLRSGADGGRVECSYWGVAPDGMTATPLGTGDTTSGTSHVDAASGAVVVNNLFSGNADDAVDRGLVVSNVDGATVRGNIFGLAADGMTLLPNGSTGLYLNDSTGVTIGGTTPETRNILSGNGGNGIQMAGLNSGIALRGNLIGLARDGTTARGNEKRGVLVAGTLSSSVLDGNTVSANAQWGAAFGPGTSVTDLAIANNRFGTDATGMLARGNTLDGLHFHLDAGTSPGLTITDNVISANGGAGLVLQDVTEAMVQGNLIGVGADGTTPLGGTGHGVLLDDTSTGIVLGGTGAGTGNTVAHNGGRGIVVSGAAHAALLRNSIHSNGGPGIDLGGDGVTANDAGDGDAGPNERLNHPVIDAFEGDGSGAVSYAITLDVPAHGPGYRVAFFTTDAPDATHGEGQIFLGAVDVAGPGTHAGGFTAAAPVAVGRSISATTTRRTAGGFDITSEFSANATSRTANPAQLVAAKSVAVVDDGLVDGDDTVAIPGATLRYTLTIRNDGAGAADADTTVIVDQIPHNGSLKVTDFGGTPGAGPLGVTQGSPPSGLTYAFGGLASPTDDLEFSADGGMSWTYAPADGGDGTDPSVTHLRVRPDGAFSANGGTPPSIDMNYEVVLF